MAVDLSDLIENLENRVSPPGSNLYPNATPDQWLLSLRNAFWEGKVQGLYGGFRENAASVGGAAAFGEGIITPNDKMDDPTYDDPAGYVLDVDMSRELQQLIVMFAAWKTTLTQFQNVTSGFKAKAGPVEFEQQRSATLLKDILDQLRDEIKQSLFNLSTLGIGRATAVFDAVIERSYATSYDETWWVR